MISGTDSRLEDKRGRVDAEGLFTLVMSCVVRLLGFRTQGSYSLRDLACIIVEACCRAASITQVCRDLERAPDESTVRHHLSKLSMASLEVRANRVLPTHALKALPRRRLKVAMDLTFIPYHGSPARRSWELRRGKAKRGTSWFHVYASAYVMLQGRRFTLAVKYVRRHESYAHVVAHLLKRLEALGVRIGCLYLDRQFYRIDVINLLKAKGIPFLMPVICRGSSGGVRKLLQARRSYTAAYTMRNRAKGTEASFQVHVVRVYLKRRYGKRGSLCYGYAFHGAPVALRRVFDEYRRRFGIESSYRLMNLSRARTASRDPKRRLLFVAVSFILLNAWVYAKWAYLGLEARTYGKEGYENPLPYRTMLTMICTVVTQTYGAITEVTIRQPEKFPNY